MDLPRNATVVRKRYTVRGMRAKHCAGVSIQQTSRNYSATPSLTCAQSILSVPPSLNTSP